jgi:tRNA U34 5-methylaminomethyl-2-thiouridine-forming methyltransferase MnmC
MSAIARLTFLTLALLAALPEGTPMSATPAVAQQVRRGVNRGAFVRARVARPGPRRAIRRPRPRRPALRVFGVFRR